MQNYKFPVFVVTYSLVTVSQAPDPRLHEGWDECSQEQKDLMLTIFEKSPFGKIKYWEATIVEQSDANAPCEFKVVSEYYDTDTSKGLEELATLSVHAHVAVEKAHERIAPVQVQEQRIIQWDQVVKPVNGRN